MRLHEGTTASVDDLVVIRLNDRRLSIGGTWVKKGDRWHVTRRYDDSSLGVRPLGRSEQPYSKALVLLAQYVREKLELGYASTVHRAQGDSVDTAHALVDPEASSRELFYVAMTRGKRRNHAYVIVPDPQLFALGMLCAGHSSAGAVVDIGLRYPPAHGLVADADNDKTSVSGQVVPRLSSIVLGRWFANLDMSFCIKRCPQGAQIAVRIILSRFGAYQFCPLELTLRLRSRFSSLCI